MFSRVLMYCICVFTLCLSALVQANDRLILSADGQSSTRYGGVASRAVDGNTVGRWGQGSVTHTADEYQPWWSGSLAEESDIAEITLWNRTNCCSNRLTSFYVFVSSTPFTTDNLTTTLADSNIWSSFHSGELSGASVTIPVNTAGRYIRVQLNRNGILSLAEVEVVGSVGESSDGLELSVADQSSTRYSGSAARAVDGNTNGQWRQSSTTHTANEYQPWWSGVLSTPADITDITLWNRTDTCCTSRLTNFYVLVSSEPFASNDLSATLADNQVWRSFHSGTLSGSSVTIPVNTTGQYIRVQLNQSGVLSLAEVEVNGSPISSPDMQLCEGYRINDKQNRPMGSLARPNPGQSYIDPVFNSSVTRISNSSAVSSRIVKTMYNTIQAWNSDESLMVLYHGSDGHYLYNGNPPYELKSKLNIIPKDIEQVFWHFNDADKIIYPDKNNRLMQYSVVTQASEVIKNFDDIPACAANGITAGSDVQMMPIGSDAIALRCGTNFGFRFDLSTQLITPMSVVPGYNAPQIFPGGRFAYHNGAILESDMQLSRTLALNSGVEHSHLGQLHDGTDAYFSVAFGAGNCESNGSLVVHSPVDGSCRVLVGEANGYPYALSGTHMNAGSYKTPGWVVASSVGYGAEGDSLLEQELYIANTDPDDPQVCRIAHHRSNGRVAGSVLATPYLSEPHPVLSPSGTRVLFSSDWNNSGAVDVYVIELPVHAAQ